VVVIPRISVIQLCAVTGCILRPCRESVRASVIRLEVQMQRRILGRGY
jgi:hypothetical protein